LGGGALLDLKNYTPKKENGYSIIEGVSILRKDITRFKRKDEIDSDDVDYLVELVLEFADVHDLETTIETTLEGKSFEKTVNEEITIYTVELSPIEQLIVTPQSFQIIVNEEFYVQLNK